MREFDEAEREVIREFVESFCEERRRPVANADGSLVHGMLLEIEAAMLNSLGFVRDEEWIIARIHREPENPQYGESEDAFRERTRAANRIRRQALRSRR